MAQRKSGRSVTKAVSAAGKRAPGKAKAGRSKSSSRASSSSTGARKRGSGKRDLVKTPTGTFFARRDGEGQFREMDEVGRSLAADRRRKAKTKVASGYCDRGDR